MATNMRPIIDTLFAVTFALCIIFSVTLAFGQTAVTGIVLDASGTAMTHAFVEALPRTPHPADKGTVGDRPVPWTPVDDNGQFTIMLSPGRYKIRAKDEALGFPDPEYWLNTDPSAVFPEITVGENEVQGVRVVLGKKGGVIAGELIDKESGTPISRGKITLRDAENRDAFVEIFSHKSGHFEFTVASKPIIISASAASYNATSFNSGGEVTLLPGEHREITVELQHQK